MYCHLKRIDVCLICMVYVTFLMPSDRLALAVLVAALSPDLNASKVFSSPRNSAVIHGFWFALVVMVLLPRVVMVLLTVTSSMQFYVSRCVLPP